MSTSAVGYIFCFAEDVELSLRFVAVELNPSAWPSTAHVFGPDDAEFLCRRLGYLGSLEGSVVHMFLGRSPGYLGSLEGCVECTCFYAEVRDTLGPSKAAVLFKSAVEL